MDVKQTPAAIITEDQFAIWSQDPLRRLPLETLVAWRARRPAVVARCLAGECSFEVVAASVNDSKDLNAEDVWSAMLCLKHDVACPVQGGWSAWSAWGACSARCGGGAGARVRSCSRPPPSRDALACRGARLERRVCQGVVCAALTDGKWSTWSPWSACAAHVRRRARTCTADAPQASLSACDGERVQLEECPGGSDVASPSWSCWSPWATCSAACGRGRRARVRGCAGATCVGRHVELAPCYRRPCASYVHQVVTFNGLGELMFAATGSEARILHVYVRFLPLSSTGTLLALNDPDCDDSCPSVAIFLTSGQLVLEWSSVATLRTERPLDAARWHEVLVSVSTSRATMRIDAEGGLYSTNITYHRQVNFDRRVVIGSNFSGQISDVIINFEPLMLWIDKKEATARNPYSVANIGYEKANIEEGSQSTANGFLLRIPCFKDPAQWRIEMSILPNSDEGLIVFMQNPSVDNWLNVSLQNSRVLLTVSSEGLVSEERSHVDLEAKTWIELILTKNKGSNAIEMTINGGNPLILVLVGVKENGLKFNDAMYSMCEGEMFIGGVPRCSQVPSINNDSEVKPLSATVGHVTVDAELLDLSTLSKEKSAGTNSSGVHLASRTASSAKLYRSTSLTPGSWVQLSCFVSRVGALEASNATQVRWYWLGEPVLEDEHFTIKHSGRYVELKINTSRFKDNVEGFFTCRDERHGVIGQRNMVTYGVWSAQKERRWDPRWAVSAVLAVVMVVATILWLFVEAIQDFKTGHGLFRDNVLTKEEEAKQIIAFLELPRSQALVGSRSAVRFARAKIRRRAGLHRSSSVLFAAERESFLKVIKDNGAEFDSDEGTAESPHCEDHPTWDVGRETWEAFNGNYTCPSGSGEAGFREMKVYYISTTLSDSPSSSSQDAARKVFDMFKLDNRRG